MSRILDNLNLLNQFGFDQAWLKLNQTNLELLKTRPGRKIEAGIIITADRYNLPAKTGYQLGRSLGQNFFWLTGEELLLATQIADTHTVRVWLVGEWNDQSQLDEISTTLSDQKIKFEIYQPNFDDFLSELEWLNYWLDQLAVDFLNAKQVDQLNTNRARVADRLQSLSAEYPLSNNLAKKIAWFVAGKTSYVTFASELELVADWFDLTSARYAKNLSFSTPIASFDHFAASGWWSHPIEKPFANLDFYSSQTNWHDNQQFFAKSRWLSGKMPAAREINLDFNHLNCNLLWGIYLSTVISFYLAVLNRQAIGRQVDGLWH